MKKLFYCIGLALSLIACTDNDDSEPKLNPHDLIVGEWIYDHPEEGYWEECIYTASGKYYVSSNFGKEYIDLANYKGVGTYNLDGDDLTVEYNSNVFQWDLVDVDECELTIISEGQYFTYSRVLGKYTLSVGDVKKMNYGSLLEGESVLSFNSHNPETAVVSNNGEITALEVGFTYIDIVTSKGTRVVRVDVEDSDNLFVDYTASLIWDFEKVVKEWGDNYYFKAEDALFYLVKNKYISKVKLISEEKNGTVSSLNLQLNTLQTDAEERKQAIHDYLSKKYEFRNSDEEGNLYYHNWNANADFKMNLGYFVNDEMITFMIYNPQDLWRDYSLDFGKTASQLKSEYGEPIMVDEDGLIVYKETNDYINYRAYALNETTQKVCQVLAKLHNNFNGQTILDELQRKYVYYEKGSKPSENLFAFKNEKETVGVVLYGSQGFVVYVDLTVSSSRTMEEWIPSELEFPKVDFLH